MNTDVIIVGAGPAGSTAAREIASRGKRVLLLDRARFPRDKPCGGAVTIRCANLLPFDLSPVIEDEVTGARIRLRNGPDIVRDHPHTLTYMTQRRRFDHYLVEQAQEAGVDFRDGQRVQRAERLGDGTYEVTVGPNGRGGAGGTEETHRAPVVLGADGANGVIATALGYEHPAESAVALEANLPCPDGVPDWLRGRVALQLGVMEGGYGWLFPKGDHVNVGCVEPKRVRDLRVGIPAPLQVRDQGCGGMRGRRHGSGFLLESRRCQAPLRGDTRRVTDCYAG